MKRNRIILALWAVALVSAACTAVDIDRPEQEQIRFQVARYGVPLHTTKAHSDYKDGFQGVPFGAYVWFKGEDPADNTNFMVNQKISYVAASNLWAPEGTTFYWPKSGSLDFICYSPYSDSGNPVVTENKISFSSWDVGANPDVDLLYADKMTGLTQNATTYYYNGVPVLFRHALSRLQFSMSLAYSEITSPTGDKTKWEVTVNSATLKDVRRQGSVDIDYDGSVWTLPASRVWTPDSGKMDIALDCSGLSTFTGTDAQTLGEGFLVMPQALDLGQTLVLNITIKTWRDTGSGYAVDPLITEANVDVQAPLSCASLTGWGINQSIKYNIKLSPSKTVVTDQPTEITFDPATADWESVTFNAEIKL